MFRLKITVMAIFTEVYSFRLNVGWDRNVIRDTKCRTEQSFIVKRGNYGTVKMMG